MSMGLIGRKLGMTRVFAEDGAAVPVTVIEAGPCRVVQVRDGGVQLGFGARRASRTTKAELGHAKKAGLEAAPQVLRTFAAAGEAPAPGAEIKVDIFAAGELVKVTGRARQGSTRAPHWRGGGIVFGPIPRDYRTDIPRKVKQLARKSALNARAREGALHVVEQFAFRHPKTARLAALLASLGLAG